MQEKGGLDGPSPKRGPGKPPAYVWCCFKRGPYHNKRSSATCNYCGVSWQQPTVSQLESHIRDLCKGPGLTEEERQTHTMLIARSKMLMNGSSTAETATPARTSGIELHLNKKRPAAQTLTLPHMFATGKMTAGQVENLHRLCLRWAACAGISFSAFDHPTWKEFVAALRASYPSPSKFVGCSM
jgi:hypothetical protein